VSPARRRAGGAAEIHGDEFLIPPERFKNRSTLDSGSKVVGLVPEDQQKMGFCLMGREAPLRRLLGCKEGIPHSGAASARKTLEQ
jgi:hypothetical protein